MVYLWPMPTEAGLTWYQPSATQLWACWSVRGFFWSAFGDASSQQSLQVPGPLCQDLPAASGMCGAPAAAHQRTASSTEFPQNAFTSSWETPEYARTSHVAYRLGSLTPLLSHCLKGLQLPNSLAPGSDIRAAGAKWLPSQNVSSGI